MELDRVVDAEERLKIKLPVYLKQFYLSIANIGGFTSAYEQFEFPEDMVFIGDVLVFARESMGNCVWGIKKSDIASDNPDVYVSDDYDTDAPQWVKDSKFNEFVKDFIYLQCVQGAYPFNGSIEDNITAVLEDVSAGWTETVNSKGVHIYQKDRDLIWYHIEDANIAMLLCSSQKEDSFTALQEKYGFTEF